MIDDWTNSKHNSYQGIGPTTNHTIIPVYFNLKCFFQALLYTAMGEHFDCSLAYNKAKNNIDVFTIEHVNTIAIKTAFYSIKLPIFLTLLLIKNGQEKATKELSDICLEIGRLLQFQVVNSSKIISLFNAQYFIIYTLTANNKGMLSLIIR